MSGANTRALQEQEEHDSSSEDDLYTAEQDEQEGEEELCWCEQFYQNSGNQKKVLYLMCIGLSSDNGPLFSLEREPWSRLPKSSLRPKNNDCVKEVERRSKQYNIQPIPRPNNWTRQQIVEWLERNPICEPADIAFLTKEVRRVQDVLIRAQLASAHEGNNRIPGTGVATNGSGSTRNWRGPIPYLRVIMCLTFDHVKSLFLDRANAQTRHKIDARNSNNR